MPFPAFFLDKDSSLFFQVQLSSMVYTWSHQEQIPMKEGTL